MAIFQIVYFPAHEQRNSPYDYIVNLPKIEQAHIYHRLKYLLENPINEWPKSWIHQIKGKIYQLTAGDQRIMYYLDQNKIVILHAFRKRKQKTDISDIQTAIDHYNNYLYLSEG
jgi:phage-related protein